MNTSTAATRTTWLGNHVKCATQCAERKQRYQPELNQGHADGIDNPREGKDTQPKQTKLRHNAAIADVVLPHATAVLDDHPGRPRCAAHWRTRKQTDLVIDPRPLEQSGATAPVAPRCRY